MGRVTARLRWTTAVALGSWALVAAISLFLLWRTEQDRITTADALGERTAFALAGDAQAFFADRVKWQQDLAASSLTDVADNEAFAARMGGARTPFALLLDGEGAIIATYPERSDIGPGTPMAGRFGHIDTALDGRVGYWTLDAGARTETGTIVAIATPFVGIDGQRILTTAFELGSVDLPSSLRTAVSRLVPDAMVGIVDDDGILLSGESIGDVTSSAERIMGPGATPDDVRIALGSGSGYLYETGGTERIAFGQPLGDGSLHLVASFARDDLRDAIGGVPTAGRIVVPLTLVVLAVALARRRAEDDDRLSQERAFFSGLVPMISTSADGSIRRVNSGAERLLGRSESQLAGSPLGAIRPDHDGSQPLNLYDGSVNRLVVARGDGSAIAAMLASAKLPNAHPDGSVMIHAISDESESLASQARIAAQANEWRALVDHSPLPFALVDHGGRIERVNEALERLTGRARSELVGRRAIEVLSYGLEDGPLARLLASVEPNIAKSTEHQVTKADGSIADLRTVAIGIAGADSGRTMLQSIDVTKTNRLTRELERSREALEQFASRAAHDLKSPLSTIAGFAYLIEEGGVGDGSMPDVIGRIRRSATRAADQVQALLEDAMRVAEAERTEVDLRTTRSWLEDLLATELMTTSGSIDLDADIPWVLAEEIPFRQVLHNICSNSIKYARPQVPPRIVIRASIDGGVATVAVEDNGAGVPDDALEMIFREGYQGDGAASGVGMGLATVRSLVTEFGGTIRAERNEPHGLRMVVTIPDQDRGDADLTAEVVGARAPRSTS